MMPIPPKLRNTLSKTPRMRVCELARGEFGDCEGKVEWHHVWIYAGTQIQEHWAILSACERHHDMVKTHRLVKEEFERRSLRMSTIDELAKYPKKNWAQIISYLDV